MMIDWKHVVATTVASCLAVASFVGLRAELKLIKTEELLRDAQVLAQDKNRERDACWTMYQEDERKLKNLDDSCSDINCKEMFSNEAAGVVSSAYMPGPMSMQELIIFCNHNDLVNLGKGFPGAKLSSIGQEETDLGHGKANLVTCSWIMPSNLWCHKNALAP